MKRFLLIAAIAGRQRSENSDMVDTAWQFQYLAERDAARAELVEVKKKLDEQKTR